MNLIRRQLDLHSTTRAALLDTLSQSRWSTLSADKLGPYEVPVIGAHLPPAHLEAGLDLDARTKRCRHGPSTRAWCRTDLADEGGGTSERTGEPCDPAGLRLEPSVELHGRTIKHCFDAQSIANVLVGRRALAMLSKRTDAARTREWLVDQLQRFATLGKNRAGLAAACGVTRQAVDGWVRTGRVSKSSLGRAISYFGVPGPFDNANSSQAGGDAVMEPTPDYKPQPNLTRWPFMAVSYTELCALDEAEISLVEAYIRALLDRKKALAA